MMRSTRWIAVVCLLLVASQMLEGVEGWVQNRFQKPHAAAVGNPSRRSLQLDAIPPTLQQDRLAQEVSSITHGHFRAVFSCFLYLEYARALLESPDKEGAYRAMQASAAEWLKGKDINPEEISLFDRLLQGDIWADNGRMHSIDLLVIPTDWLADLPPIDTTLNTIENRLWEWHDDLNYGFMVNAFFDSARPLWPCVDLPWNAVRSSKNYDAS